MPFGGDFLLISEVRDEGGKRSAILFVRAGTHADLLGSSNGDWGAQQG